MEKSKRKAWQLHLVESLQQERDKVGNVDTDIKLIDWSQTRTRWQGY